ncbi:MAG: LacI family DNA-binding transcriptional regulator [Firmicutes bacterium]|nr:LacI family DNA-binding transcriptional regulator [Bacillota bacterium]
MTTIKDISRKCGVSPATVSKALNGYTEISPETVELIRRTAKEMHYMPNAAARQLKTNASHNLGVLFVDDTMSGLTHEYFSLILNSVKEEAEALGYDITFLSQRIGGQRVSFLEHCLYRRCDGVVIASVDFESEPVMELIKSKVPVVTIDYSYENTSSVLSDNREGAYELTSYLIRAGHEKIAFIHGERTSVTDKRIEGFYQAMKDRNVEVKDEYVVSGRYHDPESARKATSDLLDLKEPPTAIMYPDDYAFLGGMAEIRERKLSIPEDISVTGYDGISLAGVMQPNLTTWHQDADQIGRKAVRNLVETIEKRDFKKAEQISVSGELFDGYSVKNLDFMKDESESSK